MGTGLSMFTVRLKGVEIQAHLGLNVRLMMIYGGLAMGYYALAVPALHQFVFKRRTAVFIMGTYLVFTLVFVYVAIED